MRLTDLGIRALKPPENGYVLYTDDALPGFAVRVSMGGTKSFVLTHPNHRRKRQTIGRVGIIKLAEAREAAKIILAESTLGKFQTRSRCGASTGCPPADRVC